MITNRPQADNPRSGGSTLLGIATYDTRSRRWTPVRHAGFAVGGAVACLVPLAAAIAQILGAGAA